MTTVSSLTSEEATALGVGKKRRNDLVIFVGRNAGQLHDNVKYLYLHAVSNNYGFESYFYTTRRKEYEMLQEQGLPVLTDTGQSIKMLSSAGMLVVDDLPHNILKVYELCVGAKKMQVWHGTPLKKVGFPEIASEVNMSPEKAEILRFSYSSCDIVASTSPWVTQNLLARVFKAKTFMEYGYPRNDVLLRPPSRLEMLNVDVETFRFVQQQKKKGAKIAIYMPTFRDTGLNFLDEQNNFVLDHPELSRYAEETNTIFLMKLHPYIDDRILSSVPGIVRYPSTADIYPLLSMADVLITDYSSVYYDFLLLNKPILFFTYDHNRYINQDRELFYDFESMAPGPIASTQAELLKNLTETIHSGHDAYAQKREEMRDRFYSYQDAGACTRICNYIRDTLQSG